MSESDKKLFYSSLLTLLSSFDQWEEVRVLYDSINSLLNLSDKKIVFAVFCTNAKGGKYPPRILWPLDKKLRALASTIISNFKSFDSQQGVLSLGENKGQRYYSLWPIYALEEDGSEMMGFLATFFRKSMEHIHGYKELKKAKTLMYLDDVSGLYNQRKLMQDLDSFVLDPNLKHSDFSLLFIDIDHFKKVNDDKGHLVGTELLVRFADVLKTGVRDGDLCYRYGGDEFVVILPNIESKEAYIVAERLLTEIKKTQFHLHACIEPVHISASIGVASFPQDAKNREDILAMADHMMYQAKNSGRGQVCHISQFINQKRTV